MTDPIPRFSMAASEPLLAVLVGATNRRSPGTKDTTLQYGVDGSLTFNAGNASPGADLVINLISALPEDFSVYLRAYWGDQGISDGSWTPPEVHKIF